MRRWMWVPILLLVILMGVALGIAAYHAGYDHGLTASGHVTEIVRDRRGFGFGFFLFPLFFFFLFFFLIRAAFFGRRWGGPGWGPDHGDHGDWKGRRNAMFEDWHRRQHEQASGDHPGAGGEPSTV
jgi:F0F1-type ATP synthase membrane subunit c/vacuolar-type H+-ATPase subunit K